MAQCQVNEGCNNPAFRGCENPHCGKAVCDSIRHKKSVGYPISGDLGQKRIWCVDCVQERKQYLAEHDRETQKTGRRFAAVTFGLALLSGLAAWVTAVYDNPIAATICGFLAALLLIVTIRALRS